MPPSIRRLPSEEEGDRDHLQEIQDLLEHLDEPRTNRSATTSISNSLDLCPECRRKFIKNPLGRPIAIAKAVGFSKN